MILSPSRFSFTGLLSVLLILIAGMPMRSEAQARAYPEALSGGNYMHNFYFPPAPSSTPWAPDWSPVFLWLAVVLYGSIWQVDPQSGEAFELPS